MNVANTSVTDAGLSEFAKMPRLKKLLAFGCDNTYAGWESTPLKEHLEELYFDRPDTGLGGEVAIRQCPKAFSCTPALRSIYLASHR